MQATNRHIRAGSSAICFPCNIAVGGSIARIVRICLLLTFIVPGLQACGPWGAPLENPRMCQKLEEGQCPEGLDMFLRTRPELYVSGEAEVEAGESILVNIENISDPDNPQPFYDTKHTVAESGVNVTIPLKPGRLPVGSYRLLVARPNEEPAGGLLFSVWNTQAEIDARRELGDQTGVMISNLRLCKQPVENNCEESFHTVDHGVQSLHFSLEYDDALDGTELTVSWLRNGRQITNSARALDHGSGQFYGMVGYENRSMDRGEYTVVITASKSKQGILRKSITIR